MHAVALIVGSLAWWALFHYLGAKPKRGPGRGELFEVLGIIGASAGLAAVALGFWLSVAHPRWGRGESVPLYVHAVGLVGLLLVVVVLFALVMSALSVLIAISDRSRRRRVQQFGRVVADAVRDESAVVRVWIVHPWGGHHLGTCELLIETRGPLTVDFEPLRLPAQQAAKLPWLPEVVVEPVPGPGAASEVSDEHAYLVYEAPR